ncbi:hypothetical protein JW868_03295 [Candidatus Woesearchaeota archaeon]|nr:hypothetical protein [Candidatus Woesearchaeota archaeon]
MAGKKKTIKSESKKTVRKTKKKVAPKDKNSSDDSKSDAGFYFKIVIAVIILVFAIFMVQLYVKDNREDPNTYNGFYFVKGENGLWQTTIQVGNEIRVVPFYYHPREVQDIVVQENVEELILKLDSNNLLYISIDPDLPSTYVQAAVQIARLTGERFQILNIPTRSAFTKLPSDIPEGQNFTAPIITCENATDNITVLMMVQEPLNTITYDGTCIVLAAPTGEEAVRVADRMGFEILKIM